MKTAILGIGTTSIVVSDIITESHNFTIAGFVGTEAENERFEQNKIVNLYPFLGDYSILGKLQKHNINRFVVAIGDNVIREYAIPGSCFTDLGRKVDCYLMPRECLCHGI